MFAFNIMNQKQNTAPFLSPCLSYWKQALAFSPTKLLGSFSKGLHIYILCIFQQWGATALEDWPTGSCQDGNQKGLSPGNLVFIVLPTGTAFLLPAVVQHKSHSQIPAERTKPVFPTSLMERLTLFSTNSAKSIQSLRNISF